MKRLPWWLTFVISMALSVGTWNPTDFHFVNYITHSQNLFEGFTPFYVLMMLVLWMLGIKSLFQSLGLAGVLIAVIVILSFVWGLHQYQILDFTGKSIGWVTTIATGILIWIGLSASLIWKRLTGVYHVESTTSDRDDEDDLK